MNKKIWTLFLLYSCSQFNLCSQTTISGEVRDGVKLLPLEQALITISAYPEGTFLKSTFSNNTGRFEALLPSNAIVEIQASVLGYKSEKQVVDIEKDSISIFLLESKAYALDEVIIKVANPIRVKKDTISFRTKSFSDGTEAVAEDLLRKIPGLNISDDGTIKIGNKEVEKVMVDGDDFFEKGYKVLTKNLPAAPIETVEILQRYSNNKLLKGIEESDKVALNLKLSDEAKRQWFGTVDLGYGLASENRYDSRLNLLNFGKKNKYYFFTNFNNVGYDATGDIDNLIRSSRIGEPGSIGDGQDVNQFVDFNSQLPGFKRSRYVFNNAELLSLNAIFNPTKKLKIKTIGFANWDEIDFLRNSTETFETSGTNFTNTEDFTSKSDYLTLFGKLEMSYDISKTKNMEWVSKYTDTDTQKDSDLLFNGAPTLQNLSTLNTRFDQKIAYSDKFRENKAFLLTGRYINEKSPQSFAVSQNNFFELFPENETATGVSQESSFRYQYLGLEGHLLDRKERGNLLEIKVGNEYRTDEVTSVFKLLDGANVLFRPDGFQNKTAYVTNDLYVASRYRYEFTDAWSLTGNVSMHYVSNKLEQSATKKSQNVFYINPSLGTIWEINSKHKMVLNAALARSNANVMDVYNRFALTGFRNFSSGTGDFNQLDALTSSFNYTLGNWTDEFFANVFLGYTKSFDFFATSSTITQEYGIAEKVLFKDRDLLSASLNLDRYLKFITSNLKLTGSLSQSNFKNIVNNSAVREITSTNYSVGFELRSGFSGFFNYHAGTKWNNSKIENEAFSNSFTNQESFLDLTFLLRDNWNVQIQTERYLFGNLNTDNTYYFADIVSKYDIKKNKLSLSLSAKNLFNTEVFREFSVNDLGTSTSEYRLLPRYVLLKATYRF